MCLLSFIALPSQKKSTLASEGGSQPGLHECVAPATVLYMYI